MHYHQVITFITTKRGHTPVLVVGELDEIPLDVFVTVLLLLHLEDKLVELLLQLLIRVVDEKLLEVIVLERFKPVKWFSEPKIKNKK